MEEKFTAWMPVTKSADGELVGILSDTSVDRDGEFMSKSLLHKWAKVTSLKALANHTNKMESWVGGWKDLKIVEKGDSAALVAKPWFFSKEANPLAAQIQKQVEEAIDKGENPGISIGAIPLEKTTKDIDGTTHNGFNDAELLEATWVPIQSNRNATFGHIAKAFDLEMCENKQCEVNKMAEEEIPKPEEVPEVVEEQPKEEVVEEEEKAEEDPKVNEELESAKSKIAELQKELADLKSKAVLKATVETKEVNKKVDEPFTVEKGLKLFYGVN